MELLWASGGGTARSVNLRCFNVGQLCRLGISVGQSRARRGYLDIGCSGRSLGRRGSARFHMGSFRSHFQTLRCAFQQCVVYHPRHHNSVQNNGRQSSGQPLLLLSCYFTSLFDSFHRIPSMFLSTRFGESSSWPIVTALRSENIFHATQHDSASIPNLAGLADRN